MILAKVERELRAKADLAAQMAHQFIDHLLSVDSDYSYPDRDAEQERRFRASHEARTTADPPVQEAFGAMYPSRPTQDPDISSSAERNSADASSSNPETSQLTKKKSVTRKSEE